MMCVSTLIFCCLYYAALMLQAERPLLSHQDILKTLTLTNYFLSKQIMIFPVLVHHIGQFFEDSTICRALLDG